MFCYEKHQVQFKRYIRYGQVTFLLYLCLRLVVWGRLQYSGSTTHTRRNPIARLRWHFVLYGPKTLKGDAFHRRVMVVRYRPLRVGRGAAILSFRCLGMRRQNIPIIQSLKFIVYSGNSFTHGVVTGDFHFAICVILCQLLRQLIAEATKTDAKLELMHGQIANFIVYKRPGDVGFPIPNPTQATPVKIGNGKLVVTNPTKLN